MQSQNGERSGAGSTGRAGTVSVSPLQDDPGLEVFDPIERHRCELHTPEPVRPVGADAAEFRFPVDRAVRVRTPAIELPTLVGAYVRDESGDIVAEATHFAEESLPAGSYHVELTTTIKTYLRVEGSLHISTDLDRTRIEFGDETEVLVGARSRHEHPAATITTTQDPEDLMVAVSYLGSALKTTSVERSYPTLRGHPPTIELGEELSVPSSLERPDTGVRIEVPADYGSVFVVATLAYYLGAEVVPGEVPRLVTDDGFVHRLDRGRGGFEGEVERVLKQVFFLDCVVRTEGLYQFDLHERREVEAAVDLDFADLYDRPLAGRLAAYLSVDYATVEDHVPEWKLTTHVSTSPESIEVVPFLVEDLAVIRTPEVQEAAGSATQLAAVNDFLRDDDFTRSASESAGTSPVTLRPEESDSLEQAWIGQGAPIGASKPTVESFRNRLERVPADGDIDIAVVCNDPEMHEEREIVDEVYGSRTDLPFDVSVTRELSTDGLRELLAEDVDFLHYIGHIDDEGFQCADGRLDATTLAHVGVDAFFLNACKSYEQGLALIHAGAIGGVVTLRDVINSGAVKIGATLSELLNRGFPLRAGLSIASDESVIGSQYVVVGDGGFALTQAEGGTPFLCEISGDGPEFEVTLKTYPTNEQGMGSVVMPHTERNERYYLNSGVLDSFEMTRDELETIFDVEYVPVRHGDSLEWSGDLDVDDL